MTKKVIHVKTEKMRREIIAGPISIDEKTSKPGDMKLIYGTFLIGVSEKERDKKKKNSHWTQETNSSLPGENQPPHML